MSVAPAHPSHVSPAPRKSVDQLSEAELARLRSAFKHAQDTSRYQEVAGIYGLPLPTYVQHRNLLFLPWNRAYLQRFELTLGSFVPGVQIPFWDWTSPASQSDGVPGAFAVESVGDAPNPLYAAKVAPDALKQGVDDGLATPSTFRSPGPGRVPGLPTAARVGEILTTADFPTFSFRLEDLSNAVHVFVGGHMGRVLFSAYDPLFWAHYAMVDQIWATWQRMHPAASPPSKLLVEQLEPFSVTVEQTLDPPALGHDYRAPVQDMPVLSGATNDSPALEDSLGFHHYATAFAEVIASPETVPPLTIGIFGSWGMGKSTLLESIVREIETGQEGTTPPEDRDQRTLRSSALFIHLVHFNAWDYAREEAIWPALVRETMDRLREDIRWSRPERFVALFRRNLRREWQRNSSRIVVTGVLLAFSALIAGAQLGFNSAAIGLGLVGLGVTGLLKVATDTITNPPGKWIGALFAENDYGRRLAQLEAIRDDLGFLVSQLAQQAEVERRVLVIIDDLDRCEPDKVVEVLQAINRLLAFPSFIVCMGVDARIVTAAVQQHYEGLLGKTGASGFEYLDKIIQIPFRIPEPDSNALSGFLEAHLPTTREIAGATHLAPIKAEAAPPPKQPSPPSGSSSDDYSVSTQEPGLRDGPLGQRIAFKPSELQAFKDLSDFIRPNPRHVKRLINVYRLVRTFAESKRRGQTELDDAQLVLDHPDATIRWLLISAQWPYTANGMLAQHRRLKREWKGVAPPKPLAHRTLEYLYAQSSTRLVRETQNRFDDDIERLAALIEGSDIGWETFDAISRYAVNFNPSVEEELRLERLRSENAAEGVAAPQLTSSGATSSGALTGSPGPGLEE